MSTYYRRKKYLHLKRLHSNDFENMGHTVKRNCPSELPKSITENTDLMTNYTPNSCYNIEQNDDNSIKICNPENSANSKKSPSPNVTPEISAFSPDCDSNFTGSSARVFPCSVLWYTTMILSKPISAAILTVSQKI